MLPDIQTSCQDVSARDKLHNKRTEDRNKNTVKLEELPEGTKVLLQHHISKLWDTHAVILKQREGGQSYVVRTSDGRTFIRGRRLIRKHSYDNCSEDSTSPHQSNPDNTPIDSSNLQQPISEKDKKTMPRRSPRFQQEAAKRTYSISNNNNGGWRQGLHLGSSFGAETHYGITGFQWATMLLVFIAIIWLLLRYKRKSSIASDAKRGILPPIHKRKVPEDTTAQQGNAECSQCRSTATNPPTREWLAHAIVLSLIHI